ncbi:MAG: hypothetical protein QME40_07020 [bacterium]|nr:hypothetical protein [bacterium]
MNVTLEGTKLIEKSDHALEVAEALFRQGYSPDAASKLIMLCSSGPNVIEIRRDLSNQTFCSRICFGILLCKTRTLDPKYHKMFISARKIREIADYDIQEEIVKPAANLKMEEGKEFIGVIKKMLKVG